MSMQTPLHAAVPAGHWQLPETHEAPDGHTLPHPPQLNVLVCVSTHEAPHAVSDPQLFEHCPSRQNWPVLHG